MDQLSMTLEVNVCQRQGFEYLWVIWDWCGKDVDLITPLGISPDDLQFGRAGLGRLINFCQYADEDVTWITIKFARKGRLTVQVGTKSFSVINCFKSREWEYVNGSH